jgi:serine/threonine protein kinase
MDLSSYSFSLLRAGDLALYRGSGSDVAPALIVTAENPVLECLKRLEHEYALRGELDAAWAAKPVALSRFNGRLTLVLEDPGGEPLDRLLGKPLEPTAFLRLGVRIANAIRRAHERGFIHKDIKPANILVEVARGGAWLTGFGIASRLPRERANPEPPDEIAGTLAYMAPEQTGRMNRSIDARSDLYSLGITFYEMLTGMLPFIAAVDGGVADLGGAIDVRTVIGNGTTFTIWLPRAGEVVASSAGLATRLPRGNGETVLVVDNEKALVALAEEILAELGYEPIGFSSSIVALGAFRESPQRFDIVLTDEWMPELLGIDLAREIEPLRPDLPIVLMSGSSSVQLHERARDAGIRELLRKPLQRKDIAECFRRVLHGSANSQLLS